MKAFFLALLKAVEDYTNIIYGHHDPNAEEEKIEEKKEEKIEEKKEEKIEEKKEEKIEEKKEEKIEEKTEVKKEKQAQRRFDFEELMEECRILFEDAEKRKIKLSLEVVDSFNFLYRESRKSIYLEADKVEECMKEAKLLLWSLENIMNIKKKKIIEIVKEEKESTFKILPICYNGKTKSLLIELMKGYEGIILDTSKYLQEYEHQFGGKPMKNKMIHVHCATKDDKSGKSGGIGIYYKSFVIEKIEYIRPIIVDVAGERPGITAKKGKNQYYWELSGIGYEPTESIIEKKFLKDDLMESEK